MMKNNQLHTEHKLYGDERVVDMHIKNLRKKLGVDFIQTIRWLGYFTVDHARTKLVSLYPKFGSVERT